MRGKLVCSLWGGPSGGTLWVRTRFPAGPSDEVRRPWSTVSTSRFPSFQPSVRPTVPYALRGWKAGPEVERQALIQKNFYAILASREPYASSSDFTAISRVTERNCHGN